MSDDRHSGLRGEVEALADDLVSCRRQLHKHPELGFELPRTSTFVARQLEALGIETRTGVGRSGVVGLLRAEAGDGPQEHASHCAQVPASTDGSC